MKRYAVYYAPAEGAALTCAASAWLGRSVFRGTALAQPGTDGLSREQWNSITADPRVYGFHATLKPPFRLAEGRHAEELRERLRKFAACRRPFEISLQLGSIGGFLALVPAHASPEFVQLAADCVREFDEFRAAPHPDELARRRQARLNDAQLAYLTRWGYPYVMEEWRFHMTLTASLEPPLFEQARRHLAAVFEPICREPLRIDSICLFEQAEPGAPFQAEARYDFS
jgi:putative phosphonate metabolism protein